MKKSSKAIHRNYENVDCRSLEHYGVLMKNGRARIDTKRYKKFFELPNERIEHRQSVYYLPNRIHRHDYHCNVFRDALKSIKEEWHHEFKKTISAIKTPEEVASDTIVNYIGNGVLEPEEVDMVARVEKSYRKGKYDYVIKSIYAQFYQQMMSMIDSVILKVIIKNGYKERDFTSEKFDVFIQGKQKNNAICFYDFKNYEWYDKSHKIWNFLKHNSIKAYNGIRNYYPDMIDLNKQYKNGDPAISVLKIDEKTILETLEKLPLFFDEVCERAFEENIKDAHFDYDDYFIDNAHDMIELIENPLGLPPYI